MSQSLPPVSNGSLRRVLGGWDTAALVVSCVLGSGVFIVPGEIAPVLPSAWVALALWAAAALFSLAGSMCVAELASARPSAGGPYAILREAYGDTVAFLYGWSVLVVVNCAVPAALATALVQTAVPGAPASRAALVLVFFAGFCALGLTLGKRVQAALTVFKLLGIAFVVALVFVRKSDPLTAIGLFQQPGAPLLAGIGTAVVAILWACDGWVYVAFSGEEIREPRRDLPFGFFLGSATVLVAVVALNAAYYAVLPPSAMQGSEPVLVSTVQAMTGSGGGAVARLLLLVSVAGSLAALFITGTRCPLAMARDGYLPAAFVRVSRTGVPLVAVAGQAVAAILLLSTGGFFEILAVSFVTDWLFKALLVLALPRLRAASGAAENHFRVPGGVPLARLWAAGAVALVVLGFGAAPKSALLGLGLTAAGLPLFFLARRRAAVPQLAVAQKDPST